jgi:hypothetical protein
MQASVEAILKDSDRFNLKAPEANMDFCVSSKSRSENYAGLFSHFSSSLLEVLALLLLPESASVW